MTAVQLGTYPVTCRDTWMNVMKWALIQRKPGALYSSGPEIYLGANDEEVSTSSSAKTFATRDAAEAHRRKLKRPYDWVAVSAGA
jgi:hypothetical protein